MKKIGRTIRSRRKKGKTDYKARFGMLKSGKPRLVIRKSNRYVIAQIIKSDIAQDKIVASSTSKDLLSYGWPKESEGSLKSLGACYLLGMLIAKKSGEKDVILDFGLQRNIQKGRIYAVVKGAVEYGMNVACSEEAMPEKDKIMDNEKTSKIIGKVEGEIKKK